MVQFSLLQKPLKICKYFVNIFLDLFEFQKL